MNQYACIFFCLTFALAACSGCNAPIEPCNTDNGGGSNLLINGSFEEGPEVSSYLPLDSGSTLIRGWIVSRGHIDYVSVWQSYDGLRSLDLDGTAGAGGIAQAFHTCPGKRYAVQFAISANSHGPPATKVITVSAADRMSTFEIDTVRRTYDDMRWVINVWAFTAEEQMTTLEFFSADQDATLYGPALDDVIVKPLD